MSDEQRRNYEFNTGITATPEDGKFDDKAHATKVEPLFRRIKAYDGITSVYIAVYGIEIKFMPEVLTEAQALAIVRKEVREAANEPELGLFPLRGRKTPKVIAPKPKKLTPSHQVRIVVACNTHVAAFTPSATKLGEADSEQYARNTHDLAVALTNMDGSMECNIGRRTVSVVIDTRFNTVETAQAHMRDVLTGAVSTMPNIFPFIKNSTELELTFVVK